MLGCPGQMACVPLNNFLYEQLPLHIQPDWIQVLSRQSKTDNYWFGNQEHGRLHVTCIGSILD